MKVESNKKMLLFRYSNYRKTDFIEEHNSVIAQFGYTWMMKAGKKSDLKKVKSVQDDGGFLILKSPVKNGNKYYLAVFDDFLDETPHDDTYPEYYNEFMEDMWDVSSYQWFKLKSIFQVPEEEVNKIVLKANGKAIKDVMSSTRTAVMFVENIDSIELKRL